MSDMKKNSGSIGLQIDVPSRSNSPRPSAVGLEMAMCVPNLPKPLTLEEKKYLLSVERGDLANVRRTLQHAHRRKHIDINCVDSLGRGALTIAIDSENLEMVELLVIMSVDTKDALLQAINAEFVEAVELLLEHEELIHKEGELYSWQKVEMCTSTFTPDITPLILAAHRNNYEILKILLDRGATVPMPHDVRCGCDDCIRQSTEDSLRHSLTRVSEYRALASPSLIALSSNDPLATAFKLSWELRNLAFAEQECKSEYLDMRRQCQQFAVDLLDQSRSSQELAIILNHDPEAPPYNDGDHMKLARLELAINYKQKKFVAHPNIQQLLASLWYEGVPGFRRKSPIEKLWIIVRTALFFPFYCALYMIAPSCGMAAVIKKPFMKFLIHASSYLFFLLILILVSQRAEVHAILLFGTENMKRNLEEQLRRQRGNGPSPLEWVVVLYVIGFIWEETQEIFREGIRDYLRNMWNFIDFSRNSLYCLVALLRCVAYIQQTSEISKDPTTAYIAREHWEDFDPQLIAEGLFAAANIFSALKLVHLFSINPHLGPLQISLGRMVIDIVKFFFIYSLVLFAFACGLNQLLFYFADLEKQKCYHKASGEADWETMGDACMKWRRFGNLFESSQSLFWASFGMVGLENFELEGIKTYTRFWGLLMFGSYCVINVIVLLNLLIAMMSNSYAMIDEHSDTEWKFARTKLWMSYFEEGATLPPPFNILPTVKWFCKKKKHVREIKRGSTIRRKEDRENRYTNVMRSLVWRYVSAMQRRVDDSIVTEDDIQEVKADISAIKYEILEVLERNGMDISCADKKGKNHLAKRMKVWERRLMKDFHVAPTAEHEEGENESSDKGIARFRRVAKQVASQTTTAKWDMAVSGVTDTQIGRCRNRASFKNQQNLARAISEAQRLIQHSPIQSRPCTPVEYDDPTTNTLLQLLKNLSEECSELSPTGTIRTTGSTQRERQTSITQQLQVMIQSASKSSSPLPVHVAPFTENIPKVETNRQQRQSVSSIVSNDRPGPKQLSRSVSPEMLSNTKPLTPSVNIQRQRSKTPDEKFHKKTASNASAASEPAIIAANQNDTHSKLQSPPPVITVTRTESHRLNENTAKQADEELTNDKPKVVKRKAPAPGPSENIAISRPVAPKIDQNKGMIPPPPPSTSNDKPPSRAGTPTPASRSSSPIPRKSSPVPKKIAPTPQLKELAVSPLPKPICLPGDSPSRSESSLNSGSSESLVKSKEPSMEANKAASSPPSTLRPTRKVTEVTTIKRQPKTGWL